MSQLQVKCNLYKKKQKVQTVYNQYSLHVMTAYSGRMTECNNILPGGSKKEKKGKKNKKKNKVREKKKDKREGKPE